MLIQQSRGAGIFDCGFLLFEIIQIAIFKSISLSCDSQVSKAYQCVWPNKTKMIALVLGQDSPAGLLALRLSSAMMLRNTDE